MTAKANIFISYSSKDEGLVAAIKAAGSIRALSRLLNMPHQQVSQWDQIPIKRLLQIEQLTKVPRHLLRPDLFVGYVPQRRQRRRKISME